MIQSGGFAIGYFAAIGFLFILWTILIPEMPGLRIVRKVKKRW